MRIGIVLPDITESYLKLARQIGCSDIVTTLRGEPGKQAVWGYRELMVQRQRIEDAGLKWTVVESQQPPDVIKLGLPGRDEAATSAPPASRSCVTTGCRFSPGCARPLPRACAAML
jgi:D-mannonate dehydratase